MLDDYRGLAVFVAVADAGSLSAAGRQLKLSTSVVSHHLSRLEAKLGVTLFFRSTRSMSLTPEGRAALDAARRMVEAGEEALDLLGGDADEPVGSLRVAMPAWGEQTQLRQTLWDFARRYPMVAISLHSSDARVDIIKDGFDLAIRTGELRDSSLKCKRIGVFRRVFVASPAYLASRPPVVSLEDLVHCDFIAISMIPDAVTLMDGDTSLSFEPENVRLEVDSIAAAKSAVLAGLGIRLFPLSEVNDDIASGRLVQILPEFAVPELGVYAVWPDLSPQKKLTRRLIDYFSMRDDVAST
ncbi:LysR family transcriptional regulator [Oricola thermophila]|uniref:LysR family transcriptional regulator n=1 Tax=Oricola thermophila TaxID=2742145 RepID=A0A6N1VI39_9HYPH|nr:LysR family transcriptional regulator [Oricola thermophila]QKV19002.1 LysR family transcriptional regulator [Oricola thermophila]